MPTRPRQLSLLLVLSATFVAIASAPASALGADCGSGATELGNGGFETPGVPGNSYAIFDASQVPPWNTTDDSNGIEIWGDAFLGVPAYEGANFAELNANSAGTLYQDVVTFPGATMTWTLHHRGRDTTDVMRVLIGDALLADVWSDDGWDWISGDIADDQTAWGAESDTYVVPAGQTCTRFAFRAVGPGSYGNLLDAIGFVVTIPAEPTPTPTPDPTATPTPMPEPTATPDPTATPSPDPSPTATPRPTSKPTAAVAAGVGGAENTPPPTDTLTERPPQDSAGGAAALMTTWLIVLGVMMAATGRRTRRGR